ncbi:hypothetical protein SprV_0200704100 [Sparganum proliferum]
MTMTPPSATCWPRRTDYIKPASPTPSETTKRSSSGRRPLQQRLRETQVVWTTLKAEKIQGYADRDEWKNFFTLIKAVHGPTTKATAPLLSADGRTLLTKKKLILQRWAEHFRSVLNHFSTISNTAIACVPQAETDADLDLPSTIHKTVRVVQ